VDWDYSVGLQRGGRGNRREEPKRGHVMRVSDCAVKV
jgi:hypothetical protein